MQPPPRSSSIPGSGHDVLDRLLDLLLIATLRAWFARPEADPPLRDPDLTITAVAARVGYGTPFALSAAFKRVRGVSPREHRRASTTT